MGRPTSPRLSRRHAVGLLAVSLLGASTACLANIPDARAAEAAPTRGFNLPGWVDRENGIAPDSAVLGRLHGLGFRTVRLPVNADLIAAPDATKRAANLREIEDATKILLAAGFTTILDMHPSGDLIAALGEDPQAGSERVLAAWTRLADVVATLPDDSVYAELLNEPPMERPEWLSLRDRLAEIVRARCPRHPIVWGPSRYQGIWELADTPALADDNAIVAVHYYTPLGFTHQCENWDDSPLARIRDLPFPAKPETPTVAALADKFRAKGDEEALAYLKREFAGPWTAARIAADFSGLANWSKKNGCPVILDEFGVLDFCVDSVSRALWVRAVRQAAEANGVGWTYWEVDRGFGFIRDRRSVEGFDMSMIDALLGS